MRRHIIIALFLFLNVAAAIAVAPKMKRYVKKTVTPVGTTITTVVDVMYLDRDGDGCYDYIIIWIDGDYFNDGPLLKAGGTGTGVPSATAESFELDEVAINECPSPNQQSAVLRLVEPTTQLQASVSKQCGEVDFRWSESAFQKQSMKRLESFEFGKPNVTVYPNPVAGDALNVTISERCKIVSVDVVDPSGKLITLLSGSAGDDSNLTLNIGHLTPGAYLLRLHTTEYGFLVKSIIIASHGGQR
jgi:hypothetical protein